MSKWKGVCKYVEAPVPFHTVNMKEKTCTGGLAMPLTGRLQTHSAALCDSSATESLAGHAGGQTTRHVWSLARYGMYRIYTLLYT
ncbi:hypothetical protein XELAEV_18010624mg [Xenopus laevis]|uniref:Uncharacterized protein n=1 Tax=Xenopus laevis TaxID=8355 RepID=A0A974DWQ3_XENLA|nr:hypothetical protein XELAEV_18010624mg [Xenopus laevis]